MSWLDNDIFSIIAGILVQELFDKAASAADYTRFLYLIDREGRVSAKELFTDVRYPAASSWDDGPAVEAQLCQEFIVPSTIMHWWDMNKLHLSQDGASTVPSFHLYRARKEMIDLTSLMKAHLFEGPNLNRPYPREGWDLEMAGEQGMPTDVCNLLVDGGNPYCWNLREKISSTRKALKMLEEQAEAASMRSCNRVMSSHMVTWPPPEGSSTGLVPGWHAGFALPHYETEEEEE